MFGESKIPSEILGNRDPLGIVQRVSICFNQDPRKTPDVRLIPDQDPNEVSHYAYAALVPFKEAELQCTRPTDGSPLRIEITNPSSVKSSHEMETFYQNLALITLILSPQDNWANSLISDRSPVVV